VQERYGVLRDEAEKQVDEWLSKLPPRHGDAKAPSDDAHGQGSPKH
jgi:hypothetical protein